MNRLSSLKVSPQILLKREITKSKLFEINKLPDTNEKRYTLALDLLNDINDHEVLDWGVSTMSNHIFYKDPTQIYSEKYKDVLVKHKKSTVFYEILRMLKHQQYEQAVLLAFKEYERLAKVGTLDNINLVYNLHFIHILEMASMRDDSVVTLEVLKKLSKYNLLNDVNYVKILINALTSRNENILIGIYDYLKTVHLSDTLLKIYTLEMINNKENDKCLELISRVESTEIKEYICLEFLSSLKFEECFTMLEQLITSNYLSVPNFKDIPSRFLSIPGLSDYTKISEYCDSLAKVDQKEVQSLALYSLFSSIDNGKGHLGSTLFIINFLHQSPKFDLVDILDGNHIDTIFHTISNSRFKLTGIQLLDIWKQNGFKISLENYHHLVIPQCFGNEFDTLFYVLAETLSDHQTLSEKTMDFLGKIYEETNDYRLVYFLEKKWEHDDINRTKDYINYEFIKSTLHNEIERTKNSHTALPGFGDYEYHTDIKLVNFIH